MSRRRRKKPGAPDAVRAPQPAVRPPSGLSGPPAGPVRTGPTAEFVPLFERIAGMIRNELVKTGMAGTMACFVYEGAVKQDGSKPADIKTVSLSWKTEFQKELIRKRVRDKALTRGSLRSGDSDGRGEHRPQASGRAIPPSEEGQ